MEIGRTIHLLVLLMALLGAGRSTHENGNASQKFNQIQPSETFIHFGVSKLVKWEELMWVDWRAFWKSLKDTDTVARNSGLGRPRIKTALPSLS